MEQQIQNFRTKGSYLLVIGLIILIGIGLRVYQYAQNRALWLDEAALALKIDNFSYKDLLITIEKSAFSYNIYEQKAPFGFMYLIKGLSSVFGNHEYVLRFTPLFCGIVSLLLFYIFARQIVSKQASLIGIGLMSVSMPLVRYSSEFKPYACDMALALCLFLYVDNLLRKGISVKRIFHLALIGSVVLCFSFPSLFILAGIGLLLLTIAFRERQSQLYRPIILMGAAWSLMFGLIYFLNMRPLIKYEIDTVYGYWQQAGGFMPLWPSTPAKLDHFFHEEVIGAFRFPGGLSMPLFGFLLFLIGARQLYLRDPQRTILLVAPIGLNLLASGLHKYPFQGRLILYLVPVFILLMAEGIDALSVHAKRKHALLAVVGWAIAGVLMINPVKEAYCSFRRPIVNEEIKPVLEYLSKQHKEGDKLYIYYGAIPAFWYYAPRYGLSDIEYLRGEMTRTQPEKYGEEIDTLIGLHRVWILLTHPHKNEFDMILEHLDKRGSQEESFDNRTAAVYLYDLGK